jgi:hypothetical protein
VLMTASDVFDSALSTVSTSAALCRETRGTRQRSRALRLQVAELPRPSTSRRRPLVQGLLRLPADIHEPHDVNDLDRAAWAHFGSGLAYAFMIEGLLDGVPVTAALDDEGNLSCDPLLWSRAEVLVALGDTVSYGDDGRTLPAGLGNPVQALVTFMHCVQVTSFSISLQGAPAWNTGPAPNTDEQGAPNLAVYSPLGHTRPRRGTDRPRRRQAKRKLSGPRGWGPAL